MSIMQSEFVEVKLSRGLVTIIDAEDFEMVSQHKWFAMRSGSIDYAVRAHGKKKILLHRVLLNAPDGMHVDHRNHDGLDNRRVNLRVCTPAENSRNSRKQKGCSSEFKGVAKHKDGRAKPWVAIIWVDGKKHTRCFTTELAAAQSYDEMALEYHGKFAGLNFPGRIRLPMEIKAYPIPAGMLESMFPKCSACGQQVMVMGGLKPHQIAVCSECQDKLHFPELEPGRS